MIKVQYLTNFVLIRYVLVRISTKCMTFVREDFPFLF